MIQITSNTSSMIYLTLSERAVNTDSISLTLRGTDNNDEITWSLGSDLSVNKTRWNQYLVNDSGSLTQTIYEYSAYSGSALLEKGILKVNGLDTTTSYVFTGSNTSYTFNG